MTERFVNAPLTSDDARLPAVRARTLTLIRSLWRAGILRVPVCDSPIPGVWPFLPQVLHLLRVELLGRELTETILPAVERHLRAGGEWRHEETRLPAGGPVVWPATWQHWHRTLPGDPTVVVRTWQRAFGLPENRLAVLALEHVLSAAQQVAAPLRAAGMADATDISDNVRDTRERPPWCWIEAGDEPAHIVCHARERIQRLGNRQPAYAQLLTWWHRFHARRTTTQGAIALEDAGAEPDLLYELLVLLELVLALSRHGPVRQVRSLAGADADPTAPLFEASTAAGTLQIFYQTGSMFTAQRRLKGVWGTPDIVVALPQPTRYVVIDAKNYGPANHTDALYKMMGYLYNFGFPNSFEHISAGVLAFPTVDREGAGLHAWHPDQEQALFSIVVPPLPTDRFTGMTDLARWIVEHDHST